MRRARRSTKGGYSLSAEREYPPLHPPRERALIGSFGLERLLCLRNGNACARRCRVRTARRFASASIIRCRSADLVEVEPNFRLPEHSTMRRALAMPLFRTQSAAEVTSLAPHGSKARLRVVTTRRGSWRSHVHRTRLRSACSSSSPKLPMCGVEGEGPSSFLLGFQRGHSLSRKRISPFVASLHGVGNNDAALPRCDKIPAPCGREKRQPFGCRFFQSTVRMKDVDPFWNLTSSFTRSARI